MCGQRKPTAEKNCNEKHDNARRCLLHVKRVWFGSIYVAQQPLYYRDLVISCSVIHVMRGWHRQTIVATSYTDLLSRSHSFFFPLKRLIHEISAPRLLRRRLIYALPFFKIHHSNTVEFQGLTSSIL